MGEKHLIHKMWEVMERKRGSSKSLYLGGPGEVSQGEGGFQSTKQVLFLVQSIRDRYILL